MLQSYVAVEPARKGGAGMKELATIVEATQRSLLMSPGAANCSRSRPLPLGLLGFSHFISHCADSTAIHHCSLSLGSLGYKPQSYLSPQSIEQTASFAGIPNTCRHVKSSPISAMPAQAPGSAFHPPWSSTLYDAQSYSTCRTA